MYMWTCLAFGKKVHRELAHLQRPKKSEAREGEARWWSDYCELFFAFRTFAKTV